VSGFPVNNGLPLSVALTAGNQSSTVIDVYDRRLAGTGLTPASGTVLLTFFSPLQNLKVSGITMTSSATASSGLTLARMGLYSFDETTATLLAQTAIDTTLFNSTYGNFFRNFDGSIASSVNLVAGKRYGVGVIQVGTTPAQLLGINEGVSAYLTPLLLGSLGGRSDLPASAVPGTAGSFSVFARLT